VYRKSRSRQKLSPGKSVLESRTGENNIAGAAMGDGKRPQSSPGGARTGRTEERHFWISPRGRQTDTT